MVVIRDKKWSGYAVNLCLSSGYSTIKWFASGLWVFFSEGEWCTGAAVCTAASNLYSIWSGYAVNLCLSSGYSTIKWFASGLWVFFSEGEWCIGAAVCTAASNLYSVWSGHALKCESMLCLILLALVLQILAKQKQQSNKAFQFIRLQVFYKSKNCNL